MASILIITPDYPPKLGGISTLTVNIEKILLEIGHDVEVFVWKSNNELRKKSFLKSYEYIISMHYMSTFLLKTKLRGKYINYIHGTEITFYSKNIIKRILKRIVLENILKTLGKSYKNILISEFTKNVLERKGFETSPYRDLVFHNCLDLNYEQNIKPIEAEISICCFVRDVPHKNIKGVLKFVERISKFEKRKINLFITAEISKKIDGVNIKCIANCSDEVRNQVLKDSHFNILLSLDHSSKGYFEGFGLTVLEAGAYGTPTIGLAQAGLKESIHNNQTGWLVNGLKEVDKSWWEDVLNRYEAIALECYEHTKNSHHSDRYKELFQNIIV